MELKIIEETPEVDNKMPNNLAKHIRFHPCKDIESFNSVSGDTRNFLGNKFTRLSGDVFSPIHKTKRFRPMAGRFQN